MEPKKYKITCFNRSGRDIFPVDIELYQHDSHSMSVQNIHILYYKSICIYVYIRTNLLQNKQS